jgi:uncharacterized lipoprotein YddW (UPF0748 family)
MNMTRMSVLWHLLICSGALLGLVACSNEQGSAPTKPGAPAAVRGVWLTNVASDALDSRENIRQAVALCHELGFNTIFTVTWNRANTIYPSAVLAAVTGVTIDPRFAGRDPLQELIEEAKPYGIQIYAWFEFGFSCSYGDPTGGPLIKRNPHWASLDKNGKLAEKNGFQWMNAFHPEVQDFMRSLLKEVVENYEVAGIQGDDRLPALPSNGGYDAFTVELYRQEHGGEEPPQYEKDYDWVKWRSRKLSLFLAQTVAELRQINPDIVISMSPSIYPWAEENYLQDWPSWLKMGLVDLVIPQVYRYNFEAYRREMDKILDEQLGDFDRKGFYPGVLLQVDKYVAADSLLQRVIDYNRSRGINGEVFFFYEGIKKRKEFFSKAYESPMAVPEFNPTAQK